MYYRRSGRGIIESKVWVREQRSQEGGKRSKKESGRGLVNKLGLVSNHFLPRGFGESLTPNPLRRLSVHNRPPLPLRGLSPTGESKTVVNYSY
jgi:hypothetical protein